MLKLPKVKNLPIVEMEWVDAAGGPPGMWYEGKEFQVGIEMKATGYLVAKRDDWVVLVQEIDEWQNGYRGFHCVPAMNVRKLRRVK